MTTKTMSASAELQTNSHSTDVDPQNSIASDSLNWLQRLSRRSFKSWLSNLQGGVIQFNDGRHNFRAGTSADTDLHADWHITDPRFLSFLATDGSLGVAESYLQGHWTSNDLTTLLRILCRNLNRMPAGTSLFANLSEILNRLRARFDTNTKHGSRRHIAAHYDLSNDFFELFLDPTMMYSSGWFETPHTTLHQASIAKLERICRKLDLQPDDHLLEIGTGWGGFSLHAAQQFGCRLTTTTISNAQLSYAQKRIDTAGLGDRVKLLNQDYRDLDGQYDKVVSIEMVEAVGEQYLDTYFRQCARLLKPGGRLVIQAIVVPEERFDSYRKSVDFIQKYIFPGGFLPSVSAMLDSVGRTSNLRLESLEDCSDHYARTLQAWRHRFFEHIDDVRSLGFDERFIRMWEYYLCYCEAAFREKAVRVVQIVWDRPLLPATAL
jgi:cyclopropane-fatty-acyl-phospholipid synthase